MGKRTINRGASAGDASAESIYAAMGKINLNQDELYRSTRRRPIRKGLRYLPDYAIQTATGNLAGDLIVAVPFPMPADEVGAGLIINDVFANITTALASGRLKLAIFSDNGGVPGTLLKDVTASGFVDTSSTGDKSFATAGGAFEVQMQPGDMPWLLYAGSGVIGLTTLSSTVVVPLFPSDSTWQRMTRMSAAKTGAGDAGAFADITGLTWTYANSTGSPAPQVQFKA